MIVPTQVPESRIPSLVSAFVAIVGVNEWERRFASISAQVKQNSFLGPYVAQVFGLELECQRLLAEHRIRRIKSSISSVERYRLLAFIGAVVHIHERLTPVGQNRLRGMLLAGLRGDTGLTPLQQEMSVASHLFNRGFDVFFSDMETGSGFDFLAKKDGIELEVECKRVGLSLGRKVPRWEVLSLHNRMHPLVKPLADNLRGGLLLRVFLPTRLNRSASEQEAIAQAVTTACSTGVPLVSDVCEIELRGFQIEGTPFETASGQDDVPEMRAYLENHFNVKNREVIILGKKGKSALAVSIESRQDDSLLEKLFDELRDSSASQFSKTRPGVLCVQFIALTDEQINRMGTASDNTTPSAILVETSKFLSSTNRSHIHSVAFRGYGNVSQSESIHGDIRTRSTQEQGNAYVISNDTHPLAKDRRYSIFGDMEPPPSRIGSA